jgi:hypothetical protein
MSFEEALTVARSDARYNEKINGSKYVVDKFAERVAAEKTAYETYKAVEAEYTGWSRFYLVTSSDGHIHSTMSCSTCNNGKDFTEFAWLPELSGLTEADAVAAHGALLCTVCFPNAPVEWTNGHEVAAAAKKATQCEGSGTYLDRSLKHRVGYAAGNWGTCPVCGGFPSVTATGKLKAHKPEAK